MSQELSPFQKLEGKELQVNFLGVDYVLTFQIGRYCMGKAPSIELIDSTKEPFATLTVNLPMTALEENEVIIKTWSENEPIAEAARKSGLFFDTGKRVSTGFCQAEIWKVLSKENEA